MANTFELISSVTVGAGGAASIDFTSIPATYTDIVVELSARVTGYSGANQDFLAIRFNGDTGNNYNNKVLYGNGSSAGSFDVSPTSSIRQAATAPSDAATSNTFGNTQIYIPNYAGSQYKSVSTDSISETNATASYETLAAGIWNSSSAINSITILPLQGTAFVQYSTAYLYGVKNA